MSEEHDPSPEELAAQAERENELGDIRRVMSTEPGRRFMWRLLARGKIFHDPGPQSVDRHNYLSGERGYGLFLYTELQAADIEAFRRMEFENTTLLEARLSNEGKSDE